jgi:3-methyladenine DNA glycosylase AlkD
MPPKKPTTTPQVEAVLATLRSHSSAKIRDEMGPRYGIHTEQAFGVAVGTLQKIAKELGRDHDLAASLWSTGWYEARMLAAFIDEPARVTVAQMDRWCRDFDNWGICDSVCFHLFDRTPHAFGRIAKWAGRRDEFVKRAAFALLACVALHDKEAEDEPFFEGLALVDREAGDERNFVKKSVNWALRAIGDRNRTLHAAAVALATGLAASTDATRRWVGKDALRQLARRAAAKPPRDS